MTHRIFSLFFICAFPVLAMAQTTWYHLYTDSAAMVNEANIIVDEFEARVKKANPKLVVPNMRAIKNTTPYFIYIDSMIINLPMWHEVVPGQQQFMADVCGNMKNGRFAFGLFFNGFYLAHEAGHGIAMANNIDYTSAYDMEYDANTIGMLYWREVGRQRELKRCYRLAKKMLKQLKDPTPPGQDYKTYLSEHYYEVAADPYQYGYIQFKQFVEIYEDRSLSTMEAFFGKWKVE